MHPTTLPQFCTLRLAIVSGQVSVVIPARNDAAGLPQAVRTSRDQAGGHVAEVFICVGPSTDNTHEVAQRLAADFDSVHVIANPDGGISAGLNAGLEAATTPVLVRVDARCSLPPDYVAHALETMATTGAANVGAVQVPVGTAPMQISIARAMKHVAGSGAAAYRRGAEQSEVDTAFLGVYDVDVLRSLTGWDVTFARNEDAELNQRLRAAGHRVVLDPRLRVDYEPRTTLRELARQYFDYGWWRRRMIAKHRVWRVRQLVAPIIVFGLSFSCVLAAAVTPWFLVVPAAYVTMLGGFGVVLGEEPTFGDRLRVPFALATMHCSWGTGFLVSAIRGIRRPKRLPPG